jgi:predicted dehydrogenase
MIQFAIIGASGASISHIKNIKKSKYGECKYIYSRNIQRAEEFSRQFNLTPTDDYERILNDTNIQALTITTEPFRHSMLAIKALEYDKHVLIEKPVDSDINNAKKLLEIEKSKKSKLVASVVSQNRFDPIFIDMKKQLENGLIGVPFLCETKMFWKRTSDYYSSGNGWRGKIGNVLINQGIHFIDLVIWFFGYPKTIFSNNFRVKSNIDCFDSSIVTLTFPNKMKASMIFSTACQNSEPFQFNIYGSKGKLNYNNRTKIGIDSHFLPHLTKRIKNRIISRDNSPLYIQIEDFINSILCNKPPAVSIKEAFEVLNVVKECENNFSDN